jgi:hypothetical protein
MAIKKKTSFSETSDNSARGCVFGAICGAVIGILVGLLATRALGATNFLDCATGWCWPDRIRRDHVYHRGGSTARFFRIGNTVIEPFVNMVVGKTGRTTDLKQGTIRATGVSINVNYGSGRVAHFRDQFSVRSTTSRDFSAGGDSGSIVWQWNSRLSPVGLLFAGGGGTTFCNRMSRVVTALDINLNELP